MKIELRDYQKTTVERMLSLYDENPAGKGKFVWATGCGKTVGFSAIAHEIRKLTGTNVLIIAHRDELLTQAAQKYRYIDPDAQIGKVGSGFYEWGLPITVASIQTLARPNHLKNLKQFNFGLVIVDECHHAHAGNEYGKVLAELPQAFKIGCTATDDRLDKLSNDDLFGESILTVSILDAIEQGFLSNVRAVAIKTNTSLEGLHTRMGDYALEELKEKIDTPERNRKIVDAYLQHGENRQAMAFTIDVAHAYHLAEEFCKAGVETIAVSGKTSTTLRAQILSDFEKGKYRIICNCGLYTEGYDAETNYDEDEGRYIFLSCAIMARPTKSRGLYVQCIGRILRLAPTKKDALILDATDNCLNHRLEPQTLAKVIGVQLEDGESVTEAKEREEKEAREKRERQTKVKRSQDITIDVLTRLDWKEKDAGMYVLEVGPQKHRIALVPCSGEENQDMWGNPGYYDVWARLAPMYDAQLWAQDVPLDWAQGLAERKARMLLSDAKNIALVDRNALWRATPATERQIEMLTRFKIKFNPEISKGEASDLLDPIFEKMNKKKEMIG
jgi:superfamily II DNA or RNA helicase